MSLTITTTTTTQILHRPLDPQVLESLARDAVTKYQNSHIEIAIHFLQSTLPEFIQESNDRLVKVGRSIQSLVVHDDDLNHEDDDPHNNQHESTNQAKKKNKNDDNDEHPHDVIGRRQRRPMLSDCLQNVLQECYWLLPHDYDHHQQQHANGQGEDDTRVIPQPMIQVPKIRFGKTGLPISIVSLGCMRFQQAWGPSITNMNMVASDCQDNLVAILRRAILEYGINHIETARGYGSSELQLGVALKQLFLLSQASSSSSSLSSSSSNMDEEKKKKNAKTEDSIPHRTIRNIRREDLIIQTKIAANPNAKEFRTQLQHSMERLQVDYLDLFAFHGFAHYEAQMEWVFGKAKTKLGVEKEETCLDVVQEYMRQGKIRYLGFSTHGPPHLIRRAIESNIFDYVNLHYHYFGSYTNSGCFGIERGNTDLIRLAHERDMGIFIISPYDKGGKLYKPSRKLRSLTLPEMEPMSFGSAWLWNHHRLNPEGIVLHTIPCGAARPADLDQPAVAAYLHGGLQPRDPETLTKLQTIMARLDEARVQVHGPDWVSTCYHGIPKHLSSKFCVEHNQIIWLYNMIQAFGMWEFAKDRYKSLESNLKQWDNTMSITDNIEKKIGYSSWGWTPGLPIVPGTDYSDDFANVPEENRRLIQQAEEFVHRWCTSATDNKLVNLDTKTATVVDQTASQPPVDWLTAYSLSPWKDFPERPPSL